MWMLRTVFGASGPPPRAPFFNSAAILAHLDGTGRYSRKTWGLLCLELWYRRFHDHSALYRRMVDNTNPALRSPQPATDAGLTANVA